jgi:hypothetical protein
MILEQRIGVVGSFRCVGEAPRANFRALFSYILAKTPCPSRI